MSAILHANFYVELVEHFLNFARLNVMFFFAFIFKINMERLLWHFPNFCSHFVRNWMGFLLKSDSLWQLRSKSHPMWQHDFQPTSQSHFQRVLRILRHRHTDTSKATAWSQAPGPTGWTWELFLWEPLVPLVPVNSLWGVHGKQACSFILTDYSVHSCLLCDRRGET